MLRMYEKFLALSSLFSKSSFCFSIMLLRDYKNEIKKKGIKNVEDQIPERLSSSVGKIYLFLQFGYLAVKFCLRSFVVNVVRNFFPLFFKTFFISFKYHYLSY